MTVASALAFPGSRVIAGWWRQLEAVRPRAIWVGHLLLHHLEALARLEQPCPLDAVNRHLLEFLLLVPGQTAEHLAARLHVGRRLIGDLLREMAGDGLVCSDAASGWTVTERGALAIEQGCFARITHERRNFYFVKPEQPAQVPPFLCLNGVRGLPWSAEDNWHYDRGALVACLARDQAWKTRHNFPLDIAGIVDLDEPGAPPLWQRVIIDRPERLTVVVVRIGSEPQNDGLLGFAVHQDGWVLQVAQPAFNLAADWSEVLRECSMEPSLDAWREAWSAWCRPRDLPANDVAACQLERRDYRLLVAAPSRLVERLRAARSDVFKGESWVLAGQGRLRPAALLELAG
jgi:hypothetical protein